MYNKVDSFLQRKRVNNVMHNREISHASLRLAVSIMLLLILSSCTAGLRKAPGNDDGTISRQEAVEKYGVEIVAVRRSAADAIIDIRYTVVDSDKAEFMMDRTLDAYLLDQSTGKVVEVPNTSRIGPLRQTMRFGKPEAGRTYFLLFGNPDQLMRKSSLVTLMVGEMKIRDLEVE